MKPSYLRIKSCASNWRIVSRPTPTKDQQGCAAKPKRLHVGQQGREIWNDGHEAKEQRAAPTDANKRALQVLFGRSARPDARDEAPLLLQVLRQVHLGESNHGVEKGEDHHKHK